MYTLLITPAQLRNELRDEMRVQANDAQANGAALRIFDCSFDLGRAAAADEWFAQQRIAGAVPAHLERHLSDHSAPLNGGRHPLPRREDLAQWLGSMGVGPKTQVVVYDRNGCNYCGRLWWLLKWLGHEAVAVLDGGLQAWLAEGGATDSGEWTPPAPAPALPLQTPRQTLCSLSQVHARLGQAGQTVVDARGAPRYRGETEPLDPVAGHIPGALNRPFTENFTPEGRFKDASQLRAEWLALLGGRDPLTVVHQCGSGVSAVPNLLAMEIAGLGPSALYAGSWSEWCRTPGMPCEKG